jgi:hypothetical protein
MFSYENYPQGLFDDHASCVAVAVVLTEKQKEIQPGGMSDTFRCMPTGKAVSYCNMNIKEFTSFVEKVRG